jgi:hypothetical protein
MDNLLSFFNPFNGIYMNPVIIMLRLLSMQYFRFVRCNYTSFLLQMSNRVENIKSDCFATFHTPR